MKKAIPKSNLKKMVRRYNLATRLEYRRVNGKRNQPKSR